MIDMKLLEQSLYALSFTVFSINYQFASHVSPTVKKLQQLFRGLQYQQEFYSVFYEKQLPKVGHCYKGEDPYHGNDGACLIDLQ